MAFNKLSPEEENVIVHKGTEPPGSGEYDNFSEEGIYTCRRCGTPLYKSESKFDAHCGWPSFDQEIPGAVERHPDPDGTRTEIICATCGAHLGHVFTGENMTPKNTRHCVNSLSMKFMPKEKIPTEETAVLGGGCFWSIETIFKRLRGVKSVMPGYAGGKKDNPSYEEVSGDRTGHAEVVKIEFDSAVISYPSLLDVFFYMHDPTTPHRQGADVGEQYRSIILYNSEQQKSAAERFIQKLEEEKKIDRPVVTEIRPLGEFFTAEEYHKNYYEKNEGQQYCNLVIGPKLKKLEEKFSGLLK